MLNIGQQSASGSYFRQQRQLDFANQRSVVIALLQPSRLSAPRTSCLDRAEAPPSPPLPATSIHSTGLMMTPLTYRDGPLQMLGKEFRRDPGVLIPVDRACK